MHSINRHGSFGHELPLDNQGGEILMSASTPQLLTDEPNAIDATCQSKRPNGFLRSDNNGMWLAIVGMAVGVGIYAGTLMSSINSIENEIVSINRKLDVLENPFIKGPEVIIVTRRNFIDAQLP